MLEWEQSVMELIAEALGGIVVRDWRRVKPLLKEALGALEARCCNCGKAWSADPDD